MLMTTPLFIACPKAIAGSGNTGTDQGFLTGRGISVPAPRISINILPVNGFWPDQIYLLTNNIGREWVPDLPMNEYVVIQLPQPLSRLLFQWSSGGNFNYIPDEWWTGTGSYKIEYSANSTNGSNGTWIPAAAVQNNKVSTRSFVITGSNIRWVRFMATGSPPGRDSANIEEFEIYDLTKCRPGTAWDTWGFIGDSITAGTFWRTHDGMPAFNELVHAGDPSRFPCMLNFGIGGDTSGDLLARLQQALNDNPGIHFWAIGIGSNDNDARMYEDNLKAILDILLSSGKQPIIARIPYRWDSEYHNELVQTLNEAVDRLTTNYKLPPGPDLYEFFIQNPEYLFDGLHPTSIIEQHGNAEGVKGIQRLWAEIALKL